MVQQAKGESWAEVGVCRDSGAEKRLPSGATSEVTVGNCQHKRKLTFQAAGHTVTTAASGRTLHVPQASDGRTCVPSWLYKDTAQRIARVSDRMEAL